MGFLYFGKGIVPAGYRLVRLRPSSSGIGEQWNFDCVVVVVVVVEKDGQIAIDQ